MGAGKTQGAFFFIVGIEMVTGFVRMEGGGA